MTDVCSIGAKAPPRGCHSHLAALRSMIARWDERIRYRRALRQKLREDPYLIDDIGLTEWQAEAEIAKPFWQR